MTNSLKTYQQKASEIEQSTRVLINSALSYLTDSGTPESLDNARRCLETAKYVLEGLYIPATTAENESPLAHTDEHHWPHGLYESWGWSNNTEPNPFL